MGQLFGQQRHLQRRNAAEVVDQHRHAIVAHRRVQRFDQRIDQRFTVVCLKGTRARLAVNAEAKLNVALLNAPLFAVAARQVAALHRQTEAVDVVAGLLSEVAHFAQGFALLCGVTGNFVHQRCAGDAARLFVIGQCDVVGDNHHLHFQAVALGFFRREAEVEPVTGVVFDNQQAAAIAGYRHNSVQHRIYAR